MSQSPDPEPREAIQANLVRASKFADGQTRDWALFCFFRILSAKELAGTQGRIQRLYRAAGPDAEAAVRDLVLDFKSPALVNAGRPEDPECGPDPVPVGPFHHWLRAMVAADSSGLAEDARRLAASLPPSDDAATTRLTPSAAKRDITNRLNQFTTAGAWEAALKRFGERAGDAGMEALRGGLVKVLEYEFLRQCAPAFLSPTRPPTVRGESEVGSTGLCGLYDPVPSNIAFSWRGLKALGVDEGTLASFPEPVQDGMARRARRLRDRGPSAPASWESSYGLPRMHGYFTGGFFVGEACPPREEGGEPCPQLGEEGPGEEDKRCWRVEEVLWRKLRRQIAAFNAPDAHQGGWDLRGLIGALFRPFGFEIIHIELGHEPYDVRGGYAYRRRPRVEHFGFRDGLSQPFANLHLDDTGPGQGTPSRNRTWTPVAPGELYLNLPDEDGQVARLPDNEKLRAYGTYVVFRKLEQDVVGFRTFLANQAKGDDKEAKRLAAQIVGRWPGGTPLVRSPDTERTIPKGAEDALNDFLFAADDPQGAKCPLGAHIRRANPRDTGGRGEVRRHRVLRRSISYGGSLLPDGSLGDGEPRGLLFVAMNARIDLQFEVIQADWLNSGEFLGQAGLGRCPLVGDHAGGPLDSFRPAGEAAPRTGIPRFVTTRGGEYFFAPGLCALKALADGDCFPPQSKPYGGYSLGDAQTQGLFDRPRLQRYTREILKGPPTKTLGLPGEGGQMVFVGRHADVVEVLSGGGRGKKLSFSVDAYHQSALRITRGQDLIISTDEGGATAPTRERLKKILEAAWQTLGCKRPVDDDLSKEVAASISPALRRCGPVGRIDLVDDLAVSAAYRVVSRIFGVSGPSYLTELAPALRLGRQRLSELPADWLKALKSTPSDPAVASLQTWCTLVLADVIGNLQSAQEVWPLSRQAGADMLAHIDTLLAKANADGPSRPFTLVDAFVANADEFVGSECLYEEPGGYFRDAAVILAELTANTLAATPGAFGSIMQFLLDAEVPLRGLAEREGLSWDDPRLAEKIIYECDRLNPVLPVLQRLCVRDAELPSKARVHKDDRVAALIVAANLDPQVFTDPDQFLLNRPKENYLMFGAPCGSRACWGRGIAMKILAPCLRTAASLNDLRRVAGEAGEPRKVLNALTISLPARFTPVQPGTGRPVFAGADPSHAGDPP